MPLLGGGGRNRPDLIFRNALKTNAVALDSPNSLKGLRKFIKLKLTVIFLTWLKSSTTAFAGTFAGNFHVAKVFKRVSSAGSSSSLVITCIE